MFKGFAAGGHALRHLLLQGGQVVNLLLQHLLGKLLLRSFSLGNLRRRLSGRGLRRPILPGAVLLHGLLHAQLKDIVDGRHQAILRIIQLLGIYRHVGIAVEGLAQSVMDMVEVRSPGIEPEFHQQR